MIVRSEARREHWEHRTQWPLVAAGLVFLAAYAWPVLDPDISSGQLWLCRSLASLTWIVFAVDYAIRIVLSPQRWRFVRGTPLDLLIVLLPFLRPLALLRLLALLGVLNRRAGSAYHGQVAVYVAASSGLLVAVSALAMLQVERGRPDAQITSFGDALWWAVTTVTTVGYGDEYPVTDRGRLVAAVLMFCGIALLGVVTASVASWLVRTVADEEEAAEAATRRDIETLLAEVTALRQEVGRLRSGPQPEAGPHG